MEQWTRKEREHVEKKGSERDRKRKIKPKQEREKEDQKRQKKIMKRCSNTWKILLPFSKAKYRK